MLGSVVELNISDCRNLKGVSKLKKVKKLIRSL